MSKLQVVSNSKKQSTQAHTNPSFARLGLNKPWDFALHLPLRYEDETRLTAIGEARIGEHTVIEGVVSSCQLLFRPRRQWVVSLNDGTHQMVLRFFSLYPNQQKLLIQGTRLRCHGEVRYGSFGTEMVHPHFRSVTFGQPLSKQLTPVYPLTAGLTQFNLASTIKHMLDQIQWYETLPVEQLQALKLSPLKEAIYYLHAPTPPVDINALQERAHPSWIRIKLDEIIAQQLSRIHAKEHRANLKAPQFDNPDNTLTHALREQLGFTLTTAQQRVFQEISVALKQSQPMHRLLQGDVGSGKTVVAALAATQAIDAGYQVAIMAPTEILVSQHLAKLIHWLNPLGIQVEKLSGEQNKKQRQYSLQAIANGDCQLIVGTHATIEDKVLFKRLGLIIIDEQHRFGVAQRLALRNKGADNLCPHQLMMSATPIPRTLAMTFFGDLDISTIDELPPGRIPIDTRVIPMSKRDEVIEAVARQLQAGHQVYWLCPLIEESETLNLQNALTVYQELSEHLDPIKVDVIHGQLKPKEKQNTMQNFEQGIIRLLVATTVIEVGVDVPQANLMVIEHAERYGLAQLHQLRGRVGRDSTQASCLLLYSEKLSDLARARLNAIRQSRDGFLLAEQDLKLRGPGEILGQRQSGTPLLRYVNLEQDAWLIPHANAIAKDLHLNHPQNALVHRERWGYTNDYTHS